MAQIVKILPAMQETQVQSLGQEDPLEESMATHSNILAWRIPRTEETGGLQSMELQRVNTTERLTLSLSPPRETILVAQMVKNLPAMQETQVQSLGQEDPLEEGMATHSSVLAWIISMVRGAW